MTINKTIFGDCGESISEMKEAPILTFFDPPFNQGKNYKHHDDNMVDDEYWTWMKNTCAKIYEKTLDGGSIYFMQREKNCEHVLRVLRESGWMFQNLIVWKKWTSAAAPSEFRHPKHYQILAFATKGERAKTFNQLRIQPPLLEHHKYGRDAGMCITDMWDDPTVDPAIANPATVSNCWVKEGKSDPSHPGYAVQSAPVRSSPKPKKKLPDPSVVSDYWSDVKELTAGFFSGDEAILDEKGKRLHKQQAPLALLVRIILTSSSVGDWVLDPFSGTGTTGCAAYQLSRNSIQMDNAKVNVECAEKRIITIREADNISKYKKCYQCTENLNDIWGS